MTSNRFDSIHLPFQTMKKNSERTRTKQWRKWEWMPCNDTNSMFLLFSHPASKRTEGWVQRMRKKTTIKDNNEKKRRFHSISGMGKRNAMLWALIFKHFNFNLISLFFCHRFFAQAPCFNVYTAVWICVRSSYTGFDWWGQGFGAMELNVYFIKQRRRREKNERTHEYRTKWRSYFGMRNVRLFFLNTNISVVKTILGDLSSFHWHSTIVKFLFNGLFEALPFVKIAFLLWNCQYEFGFIQLDAPNFVAEKIRHIDGIEHWVPIIICHWWSMDVSHMIDQSLSRIW